MSGPIAADSRPALVPHARLQRDAIRERWVIQAPERLFVLDEVAHAIISRCDRGLTVTQIVAELGAAFDAPADQISGDVLTLLQDLADKGVVHDQRA